MRTWEHYKKLLKKEPSLWEAAESGDLPAIRKAVASGQDVNGRDQRGYSPLMLSVYSGQLRASLLLLELGADPNSADTNGNTVLMEACLKGHMQLVMSLLAYGARLHARNSTGMTAYDYAVTFGREAVAKYLARKQEHPMNRIPRAVGLVKILYSRVRSA